MKLRILFFTAAVAGIVSASAQNQPQPANAPGQGSAPQLKPELSPAPQASGNIIIREKPYKGGVLPSLAQGRLLAPPPERQSRSPVQNPGVDLMTGRPRGIVLFSFNF